MPANGSLEHPLFCPQIRCFQLNTDELGLVDAARLRVARTVNAELVLLYAHSGLVIAATIERSSWLTARVISPGRFALVFARRRELNSNRARRSSAPKFHSALPRLFCVVRESR